MIKKTGTTKKKNENQTHKMNGDRDMIQNQYFPGILVGFRSTLSNYHLRDGDKALMQQSSE